MSAKLLLLVNFAAAMEEKPIISLRGALASNPLRRLAVPATFELCRGEHIAIVGRNGSGKSTLLEMITGGFYLREGSLEFNFGSSSGHIYECIGKISFSDAYGSTEYPYYYQQRWHSFERDAAPKVGATLEKRAARSPEWRQKLYSLLRIEELLDRELISLSSGESRRYQLTSSLLSAPEVLIMESPFIGLDPATRRQLSNIMEEVAEQLGVSFIITLTSVDDIPPIVSHVYLMEKLSISEKMSVEEAKSRTLPASKPIADINLPEPMTEPHHFEKVVQMRDVTISYGDRKLFSNLNWTISSGEIWNVTGPNGSGKSTLLSLIAGDNPKAYSLDLTLFDRRRGTGESIWDIKSHIGFVSPEMHRSFIDEVSVESLLCGGFFDTIGVHHRGDSEKRAICRGWAECFGAGHLLDKSFLKLSSGEQRLILLVRAFVKDPDLIILDEPYQGLDEEVKNRAKRVVDLFCERAEKSLLFVTHYADEVPNGLTGTLQLGI